VARDGAECRQPVARHHVDRPQSPQALGQGAGRGDVALADIGRQHENPQRTLPLRALGQRHGLMIAGSP
jgi:hypothetical protein